MRQEIKPGKVDARHRGFTLLEILVALTILGIASVTIFQIFATGLRNIDTADHYVRAVAVAESVLASAGRLYPLATGESSGTWGQGYDWGVVIRSHEDADGYAPPALLDVEVTVRWGKRAVSLRSLRPAADLGAREPG